MKYTPNPPTEPGYYWLKDKDDVEIVEVWTDATLAQPLLWIHRCGSGDACEMVTLIDALWAGPIPVPD